MIYRLFELFLRGFNLLAGHTTTRVGAERIPSKGGAVIAINHTSYVDFTYIGLSAIRHDKRHLRFMGKAELRRSPLLRWLMWGCGVIPVDRSAGRCSARSRLMERRERAIAREARNDAVWSGN